MSALTLTSILTGRPFWVGFSLVILVLLVGYARGSRP